MQQETLSFLLAMPVLNQSPILLTRNNFNPIVDKGLYISHIMRWNFDLIAVWYDYKYIRELQGDTEEELQPMVL